MSLTEIYQETNLIVHLPRELQVRTNPKPPGFKDKGVFPCVESV